MDDFLEHLIGRWSVRGRMGDVALYQEATAERVLDDLFVEMRFRSIRVGADGNPDYAAVYLIGREPKSGLYVLSLFDTAGVAAPPVPGLGTREGNSVRFHFEYAGGPWTNTFTWIPTTRSWRHVITHEEAGKTVTFAQKELTPLES